MRKFLSVLLVMAVAMVSVFATTGDKLWITSTVEAVKPEFTMYGSLSALDPSDLTGATVASSDSATSTLAGGHINASDIDVYIAVKQTGSATYYNATGFDLTVTASALAGAARGGSVTPTIVASDGDTPSGDDGAGADFQSIVKSATGTVVTYTVKYPTGIPVAAGALVGTCQFKWAANASLPVDSYSATIEMLYTAP